MSCADIASAASALENAILTQTDAHGHWRPRPP
jgi:hypothetical protein